MRLVHTLSTQQSIYAHLLYLTQLEVNGIMAKPWLMMISKAIGKLILFWKAWTWHNSILWVTLLLMKSSNHSWLRFCLDWSGWMVNNCIDFQFLEGHFFFLFHFLAVLLAFLFFSKCCLTYWELNWLVIYCTIEFNSDRMDLHNFFRLVSVLDGQTLALDDFSEVTSLSVCLYWLMTSICMLSTHDLDKIC